MTSTPGMKRKCESVVNTTAPTCRAQQLMLAMRNRLLTAEETRRHLDALVSEHPLRIGIALYKAVLARIAEGR